MKGRHFRGTLSMFGAEATGVNGADGRDCWALPSRAVPVLNGRVRLERATRCEAGKARRFLATSSVSVIRVALKSPQAIIPPDSCRPSASPTRRSSERSERTSRDAFPDRGSRTRTVSAGAARARQRGVPRNCQMELLQRPAPLPSRVARPGEPANHELRYGFPQQEAR
jgi:hypothetical protein